MAEEKEYMAQVNLYEREYTGPNNGNNGWAPKDPISATKMNNIEAGIVEAIRLANTNSGDISDMEEDVAKAVRDSRNAVSAAETASGTAGSALARAEVGARAWKAITSSAGQLETATDTTVFRDKIQQITEDLAITKGLVDAAGVGHNDNLGKPTLVQHLVDIETKDTEQDRQIGLIHGEIINASQAPAGQESTWHLVDNIAAMKAATKAVADEVDKAHRTLGDTLKTRFDELEERMKSVDDTTSGQNSLINRLSAVEDEIGPLDNSYIDQLKKEVIDAHREEVEGDTLDARFDALESTTSTLTTDLGSLIDEVAGSHREGIEGDTLKGHLDAIDSSISTLTNDNSTITGRLDALDGENGSVADLVTRIGALETEVDMTSANSRIDLVSDEIVNAHRQNVPNDTLATRFAAIDTAIANIEQNGTGSGTSTVIVNDANFDEHGNPILPNDEQPSTDADYLIKKEDKYYYWKYINNKWELISGGATESSGGTGTSSAIIAENLPAITAADPNIDYYIGNNIDGYTHYKFIPSAQEGEEGSFITILPKKLTDNLDNILTHANVLTVTKTNSYTENDAWPSADTVTGGPAIYDIDDTEHANNLLNDFIAVRNTRINAVYDGEVLKSQTLQVLDTKGHVIEYPIVGGGGGSAYSIRLLSTMEDNTFTVPADSTYTTLISARAIVKQGNSDLEGVSFDGRILYRPINEANWRTSSIIVPGIQNNKEFSVDVSSILGANTATKVLLSVDINTGDGEIVTRTLEYTITKTQISISSTFNPANILSSANLDIKYTCQGIGLRKIVHFEIDNNEVATFETESHNQEITQRLSLSNLENGSHTLSIYFTTSGNVTSNKLNYYIIYNLDNTRKEPIIGINAAKESIIYGEELEVNYTAYTPNKEKTDKVEIKLYTLNDQNEQVVYNNHIAVLTEVPVAALAWKATGYPEPQAPGEDGEERPITVYIEAKAYNTLTELNESNEAVQVVYTDTQTTSVIINRFTNPNKYDFSEVEPDNVLYSYNAYGKTNNDVDRANYEYVYTANDSYATPLTFHGGFEGFNWATNGYVDGESLTISGGAVHTIDVPIFQTSYNNVSIESQPSDNDEITRYGRTIEIDYEVQSATDLKATIIECMDNNPLTPAGFRITPNCCYLTSKRTGVQLADDGFILNESSVAAAYLQTGTRIHLTFVIEPWSTTRAFDGTYHQCVNIYINGEFANSCPYERDSDGRIIDDFTTTATMRLGSNTCILKVYSIKIFNEGLTHQQVLQRYKLAPVLLYDKLTRFANNDLLLHDVVNYEKAKKHYNCLLLVGPDPTNPATLDWPTISPFKGSPSPAKRKKKASAVDYEGKTESGLILTKPSSDPANEDGYKVEFSLLDTLPNDAPEYFGARGAYISSNNVQGTSSQKYPIHNLKIYLAKWQKEKTETKEVALAEGEEVPEGTETIERDGVVYKIVSETTPAQIKKVKYSINGYDDEGNALGTEESTLCWKADYMSTDHANTYNANIADDLFSDKLLADWDKNKYQNTVNGIRCLLFQQQGADAEPVFIGDGCLNNDKGNTKTYGLEDKNDDGTDTLHQKWEFTNNTSPLDVFKSDNLMGINEKDSNRKIYAKGAFECNYPDEGDLKDDGLEPDYNHLQLLLTWVNKRACYLDYSIFDEDAGTHVDYTVSDTNGTGGTYNGVEYNTERELKKAIFRNEFERHFNLNHVLTYYIFSEYVALCDNRAKNMFLRTEDIRSEVIKNISNQVILNGNAYPDDGTLWHEYVDPVTGVTSPDVIDWSENSHFAVWAPVLYDLDSCFGVENVGLITIKYNADWQYEYNEKKAFSGFDSIFWLMVEDTYASEIRTLARSLYNNELNFTNFYRQQILGNNNATCPAVTNQDMILKYQKPWNEGFINYAEDPDPVTGKYPTQTPLYKYIQRGTRTTQKTTFMRQRSMLLSSKYVSNEFTNSMISFRAGLQVTGQNTLLTLTANQDLYPAIMFGDSNTLVRPTYRVINNTPVQITDEGLVSALTPCQIITDQIGNSDTVKIVGASVLTDIGDISKYQPYELKVGSGTNLKRLIIGSDAAGYTNSSTEGIEGLASCILLEEINIRNLTKLSSLNLGSNGLIKRVYAKGSTLSTISLPNGGVLEEIEYGANTTNITILNQHFFKTFSYDNANESNPYVALNKLWIENTPNIPILEILEARLKNLTEGIRLIGINLPIDISLTEEEQEALSARHITLLEQLTTREYVQNKRLTSDGIRTNGIPEITGTIEVISIRESLYNKCQEWYPNLVINSRNLPIAEYPVTYMNVDADGNETELITIYRAIDESILDPILDKNTITDKYYIQEAPADQIADDGKQWVPVREPDQQYIYRFGEYTSAGRYRRFTGWKLKNNPDANLASQSVNSPLTLIAIYPEASNIVQRYTIIWYDEDGTTPVGVARGIPYGQDISSNIQPAKDQPALESTDEYDDQIYTNIKQLIVKKKGKDGKFKVFSGWDKPLTIMTGDLNIYSQWVVFDSGLSEITDLNDLNAAAWYYITQLENVDARNQLLQNHLGASLFDIQLGHDFNHDEYVQSYNLLENLEEGTEHLHLTGQEGDENIRIFNSSNTHPIFPLSDLSNTFTLALDFKFLLNDSMWNDRNYTYQVLASCFQNVNNNAVNGFAVVLHRTSGSNANTPTIEVLWGDKSIVIDYATVATSTTNETGVAYNTYRNMLVLRHLGTEGERNKLYVYYAAPSTDPQYYNNAGIQRAELTWSSPMTVSRPLILGGSLSSNNAIEYTSDRTAGCGNIYYAKYWAGDIGNGNCSELASWPHEKISYKIMGYSNTTSSSSTSNLLIVNNNDNTIKINFSPAHVVGDRLYNYYSNAGGFFDEERDSSNYYISGWHNSYVRTFCQDRLYHALPTEFQSLLEEAAIRSAAQQANTNGTITNSVQRTSTDKIYLPCYKEVDTSDINDENMAQESLHSWPWMDTATLSNRVFTFDSQGRLTKEADSSLTLNYLRYQFFYYPIRTTTRIFHLPGTSNSSDPAKNTWSYQGVQYTARVGDIWYNDSIAYILVSADDIENGIPVDKTNTRGGWSPAVAWALRTFSYDDGARGRGHSFYKVLRDGSINTNYYDGTYARALVPEFSI